MKKLMDEEIIKALECCGKEYSCERCILNTWFNKKRDCVGTILGGALDLINRQKAENERLQKEAEKWKNAMMGECMLSACHREEEIKSEAYRKFVMNALRRIGYIEHPNAVVRGHINKTYEELTEKNDLEE